MRDLSLSLEGRRDLQGSPRTSQFLNGHARRFVCGATLLAMVAGLPALALAEGGWDSSLTNVRSGFTSRQWTDRNADANSTTSTISGCSRDDGARFTLSEELRRRRSLAPDVSYGRRDVSGCNSGAVTADWGRPGAGDFFLQFWHYDFGTVSAQSVNARY